jgi:hypothetical protein
MLLAMARPRPTSGAKAPHELLVVAVRVAADAADHGIEIYVNSRRAPAD